MTFRFLLIQVRFKLRRIKFPFYNLKNKTLFFNKQNLRNMSSVFVLMCLKKKKSCHLRSYTENSFSNYWPWNSQLLDSNRRKLTFWHCFDVFLTRDWNCCIILSKYYLWRRTLHQITLVSFHSWCISGLNISVPLILVLSKPWIVFWFGPNFKVNF